MDLKPKMLQLNEDLSLLFSEGCSNVSISFAAKKPGATVPSINAKFTDMTVSEGDELILEAIVEGVPPPKIEWMIDEEPVAMSKHVKISKDGKQHQLRIDAMNPEDEGEYKIVATNKSASTSFVAEILVSETKAPIIEKPLNDVEAVVGEDAFFEIVANNAENVIWYHGEKELRSRKKYEIEKSKEGSYKLTVKKCCVDDAGVYGCMVANGAKKLKVEAALKILESVADAEEEYDGETELDAEDGKREAGKFL